MKYSIELLKADIRDELEKLSKLEKEFQAVQEMLGQDENQAPAYDRGAIGYMLHSFYNGCENIFRSIVRFFENDVEPQTWHRNLLKQIRSPDKRDKYKRLGKILRGDPVPFIRWCLEYREEVKDSLLSNRWYGAYGFGV